MKVRLTIMFFFSWIACLGIAQAQESVENPIKKLFLDQISFFPQEKIYVQTDKSKYFNGETIWFRVHLVDAVFLKQANASRYVYVELVNPVKQLVERIKLRPDSTGCFYGQFKLDAELGEGNYSLRAYTRFMQNVGEDYFCTKQLFISSLVSENVLVDIKYSVNSGNAVEAEMQFRKKSDQQKVMPTLCSILHGGKAAENEKAVLFNENTGHCKFTEKELSKDRTFLLQTLIDGRVFNKYFTIPYTDKSFDVTFFHEGGQAPLSASVVMAFKAINNSGLAENITGQVFDDQNQLCTEFASTHLGMGSFSLFYTPGRKYHVLCTTKDNVTKRFELPEPVANAVSLSVKQESNGLYVSVLKSPGVNLPASTQLIAHIRGVPVYLEPWNDSKEYIVFDKDFFPAGIVHFLLIDAERNILSERLVFSNQRSSFAKTELEFNKNKFSPRDSIHLSVHVTDENNEPLSGNFSLSVVDVNAVNADTSSNIVTTLLLASELKGYIESPATYLQLNNKKSAAALDMLMMTQGWRRYDIPNLLKNNIKKDLKYPVERSEEVTGKVEGLFSVLKDGNLSLLALRDSVIGTYLTKPDEQGRFVFKDLEFPEGTKYIVQAISKNGSKKVFIQTDSLASFPPLSAPLLINQQSLKPEDIEIVPLSVKKTKDEGIRMYNLNELLVTAKRKPVITTESPYYSINSSAVITAEEISEWRLISVYDLLRRISGVTVSGKDVLYRGNTPMLLLDNVPVENFDYDMLMVEDIKDAFVSPGSSTGAIFGARGANGAIVINTKKGFVQTNKLNTNIGYVKSIGYQQTATFYSPRYLTAAERNNPSPDYRTTIYWNPNVQIDANGVGSIHFYAADASTNYRFILEGVSQYGHLIHTAVTTVDIDTE